MPHAAARDDEPARRKTEGDTRRPRLRHKRNHQYRRDVARRVVERPSIEPLGGLPTLSSP